MQGREPWIIVASLRTSNLERTSFWFLVALSFLVRNRIHCDGQVVFGISNLYKVDISRELPVPDTTHFSAFRMRMTHLCIQ